MAYRSSSQATGGSATPSTPVPAGVQAGDIVILACALDSASALFDTADWPTGFTELNETHLTIDGQEAAVGWKRLTGADSGTYTFGNLGASGDYVCMAFAFSGRDTGNPPTLTTNSSNAGNASPTTITATGLTATAGDDLLFVSAPDVSTSPNNGLHGSWSGGFTERQDQSNNFANGAGASLDAVAAGATGNFTVSFTHLGNAGWVAWLVRIPAASSGTTVTADTAAATAAGTDATGKATHTADTAAATAAGTNATGKATHTATTGAAVAAGTDATGKVTHTATTGAATADGISGVGGIAQAATTGAAVAAGIDATFAFTVTATTGVATADGITAAGGIAQTATTGAAVAAGVNGTFKFIVTATTGAAIAAGIDATFFDSSHGDGAPHHCPPYVVAGDTRRTSVAPDRVYSTDVAGNVRTTKVIGNIRVTDVIGDTRATDVIGPTRATDVIGDTRNTDDKDAC